MSNIMEKLSRKPEKSVTEVQPSNVTLLDINQGIVKEGPKSLLFIITTCYNNLLL